MRFERRWMRLAVAALLAHVMQAGQPVPPRPVEQVRPDDSAWREGKITSSGSYGPGYESSRAFDGNAATLWLSNRDASYVWVAFAWSDGRPRTVGSYRITYANGDLEERGPRDWILQGWDGTAWVTLSEVRGEAGWRARPIRTYAIPKPAAYNEYRLVITADNHFRKHPVHVVSIASLDLLEPEVKPRVEATVDVLPRSMAPTLSLRTALDLAERYAKEKDLLEGRHLTSIEVAYRDGKPYWRAMLVLDTPADGGQAWLNVTMEGQVYEGLGLPPFTRSDLDRIPLSRQIPDRPTPGETSWQIPLPISPDFLKLKGSQVFEHLGRSFSVDLTGFEQTICADGPHVGPEGPHVLGTYQKGGLGLYIKLLPRPGQNSSEAVNASEWRQYHAPKPGFQVRRFLTGDGFGALCFSHGGEQGPPRWWLFHAVVGGGGCVVLLEFSLKTDSLMLPDTQLSDILRIARSVRFRD